MSPNTPTPDIFQSTRALFQLIADVDELGQDHALDTLIETFAGLVTSYAHDSWDLETASASVCTVVERFVGAIHDYSDNIQSTNAFIMQADLLLWLISCQANTHLAQRALTTLIAYVKECDQLDESQIVAMIQLFIDKLQVAPDICLQSILTLIDKPDWSEAQSPIFSTIFNEGVRLSDSTRIARIAMAEAFARRPAQLMPLVEGLSAAARQSLILELPALINSAATRSHLLESALKLLLRVVQPDDSVAVSAEAVADLLDSPLADNLAMKIAAFTSLDSCLVLIQFVTRCAHPNPDPGQPETHGDLRRSYAVLQLLTRDEAQVLVECHAATIVRLLLTDGLNPLTANLYHVSAILAYLLATKTDVFCRTFMVVAPLDRLLQLRASPPIAYLLELVGAQPALFSHFAQHRLAFKLVDLAVAETNSSDLTLLVALIDHWALFGDSDVIVNVDLLDYVESQAERSDQVLITTLSSLSLYVTEPPLLTELSLLSLSKEDDLFDAMSGRMPAFCDRLCDDRRWSPSRKFCQRRYLLLSLIVRLAESSTDTQLIGEDHLERFWVWTRDPDLAPMVHIQLARFWRLVFTDVTRLELVLATIASLFDDMLRFGQKSAPSSTIKSVMRDLLTLLLNQIETNALDIGKTWLNDDRLIHMRLELSAQKSDQQHQPASPGLDRKAEQNHRGQGRFPLEAEFVGDCVPEERRNPLNNFGINTFLT